jgi:hypothetical protein
MFWFLGPPSYLSNYYRELESDHSSPFTALKLRMFEGIPPLPQYIFMIWYLVEHRNNFAFTLMSWIKDGNI